MKIIIPKIKLKNPFLSKNINPHNHWKVLLDVFFVIIVVLIIFSFYILYKIKEQKIFQVSITNKEPPTMINEKLLEKVSESFDAKLLKQKEILEGGTVYKDPSI